MHIVLLRLFDQLIQYIKKYQVYNRIITKNASHLRGVFYILEFKSKSDLKDFVFRIGIFYDLI